MRSMYVLGGELMRISERIEYQPRIKPVTKITEICTLCPSKCKAGVCGRMARERKGIKR